MSKPVYLCPLSTLANYITLNSISFCKILLDCFVDTSFIHEIKVDINKI